MSIDKILWNVNCHQYGVICKASNIELAEAVSIRHKRKNPNHRIILEEREEERPSKEKETPPLKV